jgi:sec-independent protein translocase protein TatC
VTRMGIVTPRQLRQHRRYAILVVAILAMLLPGTDPLTMGLMALPLYALYEGSILLASLIDRRAARAHAREEAEMAAANDGELVPLDPEDH